MGEVLADRLVDRSEPTRDRTKVESWAYCSEMMKAGKWAICSAEKKALRQVVSTVDLWERS